MWVILAFIANVNTAVPVTDTRIEKSVFKMFWRNLLENREEVLPIAHTEGVEGIFKE
jgi:hypothetical protein